MAFSREAMSCCLRCSPSPRRVGSQSGFLCLRLAMSRFRASRSEMFFLIRVLISASMAAFLTIGKICFLDSVCMSAEFDLIWVCDPM